MDRIKILIVEDDPIIGADLEDRLTEMGFQPLGPVGSGAAALALVDQNAPDLVLMDISLEDDLDGIETARRIREKHRVPIIFLTSNADDATFRRAKATNPQAFLSKPFRGKDLKHAIELAIGQAAKENPGALATETDTYVFQDRFFLKVNERMVRLFFRDILWVEADDYYCKIVTKEREFLVGQTLKKFMEALEKVPELMRVHRSYVVNLAHVEEISDLHLQINKRQIPLNKAAKAELMARLHKI